MEEEKTLDNLEVWEESENETLQDEDNSQTAKEERYKQQMEGSKQEAQRLRTMLIEQWVKEAKRDARSLLELHDTDPKIADAVAKEFGYDNFEDAKRYIDQKTYSDEPSNEDSEAKFEKWYQERKTKETDAEARAKAEKLFTKKIKDDELREKAKDYFKKMTWGKKLTIDEAEEFADMATLYVNKDSMRAEMYEQGLWNFASTWMWMWKKPSAEQGKLVVRNGKLISLDSND